VPNLTSMSPGSIRCGWPPKNDLATGHPRLVPGRAPVVDGVQKHQHLLADGRFSGPVRRFAALAAGLLLQQPTKCTYAGQSRVCSGQVLTGAGLPVSDLRCLRWCRLAWCCFCTRQHAEPFQQVAALCL
jgi:hypothetical protein